MENNKTQILRQSEISRKTRETDISVGLCIDGTGKCEICTGIGFFDHMLTAFAVHGRFDLTLKCVGDTHVDGHHTVEDCGIALGQALRNALKNAPVKRFGAAEIPMDESAAKCVLDLSNRAFLVFGATFTSERIGEYDTCLTEEFMRAFAQHGGITLHITAYGSNDHHKTEAIFKASAYALRDAVHPANGTVVSTKGVL